MLEATGRRSGLGHGVMGLIYVASVVLFSILAILNPVAQIVITETEIVRSGGCCGPGGRIRFDAVASAELRDLDGYRLTLRGRDGYELLIEERFLKLNREGLLDLLRRRLAGVGVTIEDRSPRPSLLGSGRG